MLELMSDQRSDCCAKELKLTTWRTLRPKSWPARNYAQILTPALTYTKTLLNRLPADLSTDHQVHIAAVKSDYKRLNVTPDLSVHDRYYNKKEYIKLTPPQKLGLKHKREARGHGKPKGPTGLGGGKMRLNKANIKAIAAAVSDSKHTDKAVSDNGDDSDVEPSPKKARTNRNNPA